MGVDGEYRKLRWRQRRWSLDSTGTEQDAETSFKVDGLASRIGIAQCQTIGQLQRAWHKFHGIARRCVYVTCDQFEGDKPATAA